LIRERQITNYEGFLAFKYSLKVQVLPQYKHTAFPFKNKPVNNVDKDNHSLLAEL